MRWIVLLAALAMPAVAWLSQTGQFGPTNGAISDRYPTLLVAAGYAFSIWGVIFLWNLLFGLWQLRRRKPDDNARVRGWATQRASCSPPRGCRCSPISGSFRRC
jgi:hypothetical protein